MNQLRFPNKSAIVTGAAQGIGFEICCRLAKEGCAVLLNDIDEALALKAVTDINNRGGNCIAYPGDASNPDVIEKMVSLAVQHFGKIDIVVANAGITLFGEFLTYPADNFFKVLHTNLGGTFFLAQAAAKRMIEQNSGGSLLFMSSVTGHQAHKNLAAYGMTKAAIEMLAKNLVVELSKHRINVNTVAPGATLTERTESDKDYQTTWSRITPLGKPATVADIAETVLFLISDAAKHITGQSLVVDGGWTSVSPSPYEE